MPAVRIEKPGEKRPRPDHIAWSVGDSGALLRALKKAPPHSTAHARAEASRAILDAHARAYGCVRGGEPRRWMTADEWSDYRAKNPGYRLDSERKKKAAMKIPVKRRIARAKLGGRPKNPT